MNILGLFTEQFLKSKEWEQLTKIISKINVRVGYHDFSTAKYLEIRRILNESPNSIFAFVSLEKNSLAYQLERIFLKSEYSHSGILVRGVTEDDITAVHIEMKGLLVEHVLNLLDKVDKFAIVKLPIAENNITKARNRIFDAIANKKKYVYDEDFSMKNDEKKVYCSELVYEIGEGLVEDPDFTPQWRLGLPSFTPDHILNCGEVVFHS